MSGSRTDDVPRLTDGLDYIVSEEFQRDAEPMFTKWDHEWLRYFYIHEYAKYYFYNMATENYALSEGRHKIVAYDREETFRTRLMEGVVWSKLQIWVPGDAYVGKRVLELGCGPGQVGRLMGRLAELYVGLDYSALALHIARLASPSSCEYIHLSEVDALNAIRGSMDLCFGRHFFIHQNYENALWVLSLLRDLTTPGGRIHADFYGAESSESGRVYGAKEPLDPERASCTFYYTRNEIDSLAEACGLKVEHVEMISAPPRRFVDFLV